MCGLAAVLYRSGTGPLGRELLAMAAAMPYRGPDGTGLALYREAPPGAGYMLRVHANASRGEWLERDLRGRLEPLGVTVRAVQFDSGDHQYPDCFATLHLAMSEEAIPRVTEAVEAGGTFFVHSVGQQLTVVKDCLSPFALGARHQATGFIGTHGVAHARLATESAVNVEYAHPFWARPFPDVAVVHHGHITNYYRWRQVLEQRGYRFATQNDSEVLAVYVADQMSSGNSLEEALQRSLHDMDGIFTYVASYPGGLGVARDRWAALPLVVAELEDRVIMASEELQVLQGLKAGGGDPTVRAFVQPMESVVMTWHR
jgi:glutamate synthase domain-containing protein 1